MEEYKYKVDVNVDEVTVGSRHRELLEIISSTIIQAHQEAGFVYESSEIEQFVKENCFIKFIYANIPFSFKIAS